MTSIPATATVIEREERTGYPMRIKIELAADSEHIILYKGTGIVSAWYDKAETLFTAFPDLFKDLKESNSASFMFSSYNSNIAIVFRRDILWLT